MSFLTNKGIQSSHTGGFIGCKDALPRSYYPQSNILQLLLLLRSQCGILVSHGGWKRHGEKETLGGHIRFCLWEKLEKLPSRGLIYHPFYVTTQLHSLSRSHSTNKKDM